ncbi:hypothetical protein H0X48_02805 [Candidatus Dependentiae bacterium]|nr:hypothetical protein [Candidatus Dependentiae bacterium]
MNKTIGQLHDKLNSIPLPKTTARAIGLPFVSAALSLGKSIKSLTNLDTDDKKAGATILLSSLVTIASILYCDYQNHPKFYSHN